MYGLRIGRIVACLAIAGISSGCAIRDPQVVPLSPAPVVDFTIRAPNGLVPSQADTERASKVLLDRFRLIGVNAGMTVGDIITVQVPRNADLAKSQAVLLRAGVVAFGPLQDNAELPPVGSTFAVTAPLWDGDEVEQASAGLDENGAQTVTIVLTPDGATAFGAYTAAHVNQAFVITLDGVVLGAPIIRSPIPDGHVVISFAEPLVLPTDVLVAILVSGPLPEAWRQP